MLRALRWGWCEMFGRGGGWLTGMAVGLGQLAVGRCPRAWCSGRGASPAGRPRVPGTCRRMSVVKYRALLDGGLAIESWLTALGWLASIDSMRSVLVDYHLEWAPLGYA
jgi:hypothetical protein